MFIRAINSKAPSARNGSAPRRSRTYPIAQIGIGVAFRRRSGLQGYPIVLSQRAGAPLPGFKTRRIGSRAWLSSPRRRRLDPR